MTLQRLQPRYEDSHASDRVRERAADQRRVQLGGTRLLLQRVLQRVLKGLREARETVGRDREGKRAIRAPGSQPLLQECTRG